MALNSPAVIVGSSESVKDPAVLELEWGHAEVSRPRWSTEQRGEGEGGWGGVPALVPAYRSSPALTSVKTHDCVITVFCCAL